MSKGWLAKLNNNPLIIEPGTPWEPLYHTDPLVFEIDGEQVTNNRTSADWITEWTPKFLKSYSDFEEKGSMFNLTEWQSWLLQSSCELNWEGNMRYRFYLCMIGRKNGKTEMAALLVLMHLMTAPDYAEIYSAAVNTQQARIVFERVKRWIQEEPELSDLFKITDSKSMIFNRLTGTWYRALAADGPGAQGANPYFIVMDELHVWDEGGQAQARSAQNFFNTLITAAGARKESQIFIISTAGENVHDTLLGIEYKKAIRIVKGEIEDDSYGFACWEVPEDLDPLDENNWKLALPNLAAGLLSIEYLRSMMKQLANQNINNFFRYFLNQWVRTSGETYISEYHWTNAGEDGVDIPIGAKVVAGFDGSINNDSTGIVVMWLRDDGKPVFKTWGLWEKDYDDPSWAVDRESVKLSFKKLIDTYDVIEVRVDGTYWISDLKRWGKELDIRFMPFPQSRERLVPAGDEFINDIIDGNIVWVNEDEDLNRHVMNATRSIHGKPQKETPKSRHKIDLLMCAIFANNARIWWEERNKRNNKPKRGVIGF